MPYWSGVPIDLRNAFNAGGKIPKHVQRNSGACSGQFVHFPSVSELIFDTSGCAWLEKFAEAGARVGEAPGGNLDSKGIERLPGRLFVDLRHSGYLMLEHIATMDRG